MPKEKFTLGNQEILDVKTLSNQSKMRYILEVFNLGKDKEKNEERKKKFIELIGKYYKAYIKSRHDFSHKNNREIYETGRADLHNEIMEIITNMSLSMGLTPEQRQVASYLSENRDEVTRMISACFSDTSSTTITTKSQYLKMKDQLEAYSTKEGPEKE